MGKDAVATVHPAVVDRIEPDGANPVKYSLAQSEIIDIRWRCPAHPQMRMAWIVHEAAKAGMGLEPAAARQINGMRRDVIDRGAAVVARQGNLFARWHGGNVRYGSDRFRRLGAPVLHVPIRRR